MIIFSFKTKARKKVIQLSLRGQIFTIFKNKQKASLGIIQVRLFEITLIFYRKLKER